MDKFAKSFVLGNSMAAVSALQFGNAVAATDGITAKIHIFDTDCHQSSGIDTLRSLKRLRANHADGGYTALSCCSARLYFLDGDFCEQGYVDLETGVCDCLSASAAPTDASVACLGGDRFIIGAFERGAYLYDKNGIRLTRLCKVESGEVLTDFLHPNADLYAMSTVKSGIRTVTVTDGEKTQTAICDSRLRLRMLMSVEDGIDALFGFGYVYNKIIPIYRNGILELPKQ